MTPATIVLYRSNHVIVPVAVAGSFGQFHVCQTDGIRVHPAKGGRWYHDPTQVREAERVAVRATI